MMMKEETGYIILDVRSAQEYIEKHIPTSINIANESIGTEDISKLFQRCKKPPGSCYFKADGLYQREKHKQNFRLCRKGGTII